MIMKSLESGKDKIKKISEVLKKEILEPAKQEAERVVEEATKKAEEILKDAEKEADKIIKKGIETAAKEKTRCESSLEQACRQTVDYLKEKIDKNFFSPTLFSLVQQKIGEPSVITRLIEVIIEALHKEGIESNIEFHISKKITAEQIIKEISLEMRDKIEKEPLFLPTLPGEGVVVKLNDQHMTLDISDKALKELVAEYMREEFRKYIFGIQQG